MIERDSMAAWLRVNYPAFAALSLEKQAEAMLENCKKNLKVVKYAVKMWKADERRLRRDVRDWAKELLRIRRRKKEM